MKTTVQIEGMVALGEAFDELAAEIGPRKGRTILRQTLQDAAKPIRDDAQAKAPVDKGGLRASIKVGGTLSRRQKASHTKESEVEVFIGPSGSSKSIVQEFGSAAQPPQPYMRPAWEGGKERALDHIQTAMSTRIEKAARKLAKQSVKG